MTPRRTGTLDLAREAAAIHDHVTVSASGPAAFVATVADVVDRAGPSDLVVVSGHLDSSTPTGARVLRDGFDRGCLMLLNPDDAYATLAGPDGLRTTLAAFDRIVDLALADGYRAVRVVADNTGQLADVSSERRRRWFEWEHVTDAWQAVRPVTGVCWFDADRVRAADLRRGAHRHARCGGVEVGWRVFHRVDPARPDATHLAVAGEVDGADVEEFAAALAGAAAALPPSDVRPGASLDVDLAAVGYLHHRAVDALAELAPPVGAVRLLDAPGVVRRVLGSLGDWPEVVTG